MEKGRGTGREKREEREKGEREKGRGGEGEETEKRKRGRREGGGGGERGVSGEDKIIEFVL